MDKQRFRTAFGQSHLSRRRLLGSAVTAGAGAAGLGLLGCSSKNNKAPTSGTAAQQGTPKRGGSLTASHNFDRGFDPHTIQASDSSIFGLFYSTIIRANPKTYNLEPDLATKWETPSNTEYIFTLAPNIKWHNKPPVNGRPLTVDDIIFSLNRIRTNDPKFVNRSYLASIDQMQAVDSHTLRITTKQPDVTQLGSLAQSSIEIIAPEVVNATKGNFANADSAVGTGAFILQSSEPNVSSTLVRNPDYFKAGLPYLDRILLRYFADSNTEWAAFVAGQLDHRWVPGQDSQKYASDTARYSLEWWGDLGYEIQQAMTKKKPFDDPRVTRALRLLTDHGEVQKTWALTWFGKGRDSVCFAAGTADTWDLTEDEYTKQLEWKSPKDDAAKEALSLLSAAGFTKDKPLKFTISGLNLDYHQASVQLLQAQFKRLSQGAVDPDIHVYESATWTKVRVAGDFEYQVSGHTSGGHDPDTYFSSTFQTGGGRNYGQMSDPQLDQMIAKQKTIFDEKQRKQAVRDVIQYLIDHSPYTVFGDRYVLNATPLRVHDFPAEGPTNKFGSYYENIWVNS